MNYRMLTPVRVGFVLFYLGHAHAEDVDGLLLADHCGGCIRTETSGYESKLTQQMAR
jgi:hypothetical protein